jgi:hypothetical protein
MSMAVSSGKTHRSEGLVDAIETAETQPDATPAQPAGSRRQFGRCVSAEKNGGPGKARAVGPTFSGRWILFDSAELFNALRAPAASTAPRSGRHCQRRAEELM